MNKIRKVSGVAIATAAAAMFAVAPITVAAEEKQYKCIGGNSCKGLSSCHTASSSCAGMNSCKGMGWIKATKEECETKGGEIESS